MEKKLLDDLKKAIHNGIEDNSLRYIADKAYCIILECSPFRNNDFGYIYEKGKKIMEEIEDPMV